MENIFNKITKEEFDFLLKFGTRTNVLFGHEVPTIIYLPYGFVKIDLPQWLGNGNVNDIIEFVCNNQSIEVGEVNPQEIVAFILWIKEEFEMVQKLEKEHLSAPPDPDMIAANVQELNELGEINVIDNLAGGDILKWDLIEQLPYHKVFDKLKKNMVENKVNKAYHKIISSKKK